MNFQHEQGQRHSSYYLEQDGERVAEVVYVTKEPNTLVIEHTEVDERLKGQHIGEALIEKVVEEAKEKGSKVITLCTFAKALFDRKPDWAALR